MMGRLFVQTLGGEVVAEPEVPQRPVVECARCLSSVARQQLLRTEGGGWLVTVGCHGELEHGQVPWRDLLVGDVLLGPAFHPDTMLVRRRLEPRP